MVKSDSKFEKLWFHKAAALMARKGLSLREATAELGIDLSVDEVLKTERRAAFDRVLWTESFKYWKELAGDPERGKVAALGQLQSLAAKLERQGAFDKAAEVIFKIAKMENWVGEETKVNVITGLTEEDLKRFEARAQGKAGSISSGSLHEDGASRPEQLTIN